MYVIAQEFGFVVSPLSRRRSCLPSHPAVPDLFGFCRFVSQMEREADYIGLQLMSKACFDPHEMPEVRRCPVTYTAVGLRSPEDSRFFFFFFSVSRMTIQACIRTEYSPLVVFADLGKKLG